MKPEYELCIKGDLDYIIQLISNSLKNDDVKELNITIKNNKVEIAESKTSDSPSAMDDLTPNDRERVQKILNNQ